MERFDLAIVGAGAAGLAAGIFAAEECRHAGVPTDRIVLLDGAKRIGAKILVSGGGRCNVTHRVVATSDFHGRPGFVRKLLRAFDESAAVAWFSAMGVELKEEETGKLFPVTDSARTVVDALLRRSRELGIEIRTGHRVIAGHREEAGFRIELDSGALAAHRVVLSTGGRSLPKSGSDGAGYEIVRALGHTVTDTWPALVPLVLANEFPHAELSGIAHPARLTVRIEGKRVEERTGALLWTHFGISGPVAMDTSRTFVRGVEEGHPTTLEVHCVPDRTRESLEEEFLSEAKRSPRRTVGQWLSDLLPRRVGLWIAGLAELDPSVALPQVPRESRRTLLARLTALELPVVGPRGWAYAEVTAGGVPLDEVDPRTMASRVVPGLSLVGEILDCEGRIGGFNFQWAWSGGAVFGRAYARDRSEEADGASRR